MLIEIKLANLTEYDANIQLWRLDSSISNYTLANLAQLSADEQQRAKCLKVKYHQQRFIDTRLALRQLLAKELDCVPMDILFSYNKAGRPEIEYPVCDIYFNISHSDSITLIAIAKNALIGVDIEHHQNNSIDPLLVASSVFSAKEKQRLYACHKASQEVLFYRIWTIKEAVLKLLGTGFSLDPCQLCVADVLDNSHFLDLSAQNLEVVTPTPLYIMELAIDKQFSTTLALHFP